MRLYYSSSIGTQLVAIGTQKRSNEKFSFYVFQGILIGASSHLRTPIRLWLVRVVIQVKSVGGFHRRDASTCAFSTLSTTHLFCLDQPLSGSVNVLLWSFDHVNAADEGTRTVIRGWIFSGSFL